MTPAKWTTCVDARDLLRHAAVQLPRRVLVRVLCDVTETALPYCDDDGITTAAWAWDAARRWCRGEADLDEVLAAADATYAYTAEAVAAADATYAAKAVAAVYAVHATKAVAAYAAADAAATTAYAAAYAGAADWDAAFTRRLHSLAILVRRSLPVDPASTEYRLVADTVVCQESLLCQSEAVQVAWDDVEGMRGTP